MIQKTHPLRRNCGAGHRAQLVITSGAPIGTLALTHIPKQYHIECAICGIATTPGTSIFETYRRWRRNDSEHRIPLYQLSAARQAVYAQAIVA